jgi:hypothetical protein
VDRGTIRRGLWARTAKARFWLTAALAAVIYSWASSEVVRWFDQVFLDRPTPGNHLALFALCLSLAGALACLAYLQRNVLNHPRTRLREIHQPPKRQHLTLFVSNLAPGTYDQTTGFPLGFQPSFKLSDDLCALLVIKDQGGPRWPWEMILRGVVHHVPRLQAVSVLCSTVSISQVHLLGHVLSQYQEFRDVKFQVMLRRDSGIDLVELPSTAFTRGGWEFEEFDDLCNGLLELFRLLEERGVRNREITVDLTGGYKVTSVVAAAVTFNRDVMAQYVQTERKTNHQAIGYDWVIEDPQSAGLA